MKFDHYVHLCDCRSTHEIQDKLDLILKKLGIIQQKENYIMATLDEALSVVTAESTVDDSIVALLEQLASQIKAGGLSAADQAKVDAIFTNATNNSAKVTAAVLANTPAAPGA
jgi:hypothetical protein